MTSTISIEKTVNNDLQRCKTNLHQFMSREADLERRNNRYT